MSPSLKELSRMRKELAAVEPKITAPEIYLLLIFSLIADLVNGVPILNWFVTVVTLPGYWLYFKLKGVTWAPSLAGNLVELIPLLSILPALTLAVIITILIDHFAPARVKKAIAKGIPK